MKSHSRTICRRARATVGTAAILAITAASASAQGTPPVPAAAAGTIYTWGNNADGELGRATGTAPAAVALPDGAKATDVATGAGHGLAVTTAGQVYAWGDNTNGDLGEGAGNTTQSNTPVLVDLPAGTDVASVAAGQYVSYAVTAGGEIYAWGNNQVGQLGNGTTGGANDVNATPALVDGVSDVTDVETSAQSIGALTVAITGSGDVYSWGSSAAGQLGNGDVSGNAFPTPAKVSGLPPISELAASGSAVIALTTTGDLYGWGYDFCDELDNGVGVNCASGTHESTPVAGIMPAGVTFNSIGFGGNGPGHGIASSPSGGLYSWSADGAAAAPFDLPGSAPAAMVTASPVCNYAVTGGGQLYANGDSGGACGFAAGSSLISPLNQVPVTPPSGSGFVQVSGTDAYGAGIVGPLVPRGPTVTAVTPPSGPKAGGNTVTITGTGFGAGAVVQFGPGAATNVSVKSSTSLTATAPAGSGTVDVIVSVNGGTSAITNADHYTYTTTPTVTGLSPASGPTAGGKTVTVSGAGFAAGATVTFGSRAATHVTVASPTSLTATAPSGTGTVDVSVTVAGATSPIASADRFTYVPAPTITGVHQSHARWKESGKHAGTTFSYKLDESGTVKLTFRAEHGKKSIGSVSGGGRDGANKVTFSGKLSHSHKLKPGTYEVTVAATNSVGETTKSRPLIFTIVPAN